MGINERIEEPFAREARWLGARKSSEGLRTRGALVLRRALALSDTLALGVWTVLGLKLGWWAGPVTEQIKWSLPFLPVMLLVFKLYGLYDRDLKRISHSSLDDVPALSHAMLVNVLLLWLWTRFMPPHRIVMAQAATLLTGGFLGVLAGRSLTRHLVRRLGPPERVLFVGAGPEANVLLGRVLARPAFGLSAVGYLAGAREHESELADQLPRLGAPHDLASVCREYDIERAIVASPEMADDEITSLIRTANELDVKVSILPSMVDALGPSTELDDLEGVMVLGVNPPRLTWSSQALKRLLDVTLAGGGLLVILPFLPLVALAIKLDSRGPVFFAHERLGRRGKRFKLWKLRTMVKDAEEQAEELRKQSAHDAWLLLDRDPRVTRVGRFLRTWSIDELPQLWNVLRGEMSLVGPRPMPADIDRHISGWGRRRLDLTPGITGLWQVMGRTAIPFEEMIKLDYVYVTNWTVWGDVRLLLRTVFVVLSRRGAN